MPDSTPLGIVYPCSGETITPDVFEPYAITTQEAISTVRAQADDALFPPAAQIRRINNQQNFNAGVAATMTFDIEAYDSEFLYAPPALTVGINSDGSYMITFQARNSNQPANFTSIRASIVVNGVEVAASKSDAGNVANTVNDRISTSYLAIALTAGSTISFSFLYTGAASPMGVDGTATITRVATV